MRKYIIAFVGILIATIAIAATKADIEKQKIEDWIANSTDGFFKVDTINEKATDAGVTIEGTLLKDGAVGIGTTSPLQPLQINNYGGLDGNDNVFLIRGGSYYLSGSERALKAGYSTRIDMRNTTGTIAFLNTSSSASSAGDPISYSERMSIDSSGYVYMPSLASGAGTYALKWTTSTGQLTYDTSSARYKDNIRYSKYGLSTVMSLVSRQFEYKDTGLSDVGFIAEEVVNVIPELVPIDSEGRPDAVNYDRITSVLVKAIQELKAIVDAQAAKIEALEAK